MWRPRRKRCTREARVGGAVATPSGDRRQRARQDALHTRRRLAEHDDVRELLRGQCQLQRARHPLRVDVPLTREPEHRLDHVHKALARRELDAHDRVCLGFVPPVVPYPRFYVGALAGAQQRSPTVAQDGQLPLDDAEALRQRRVQVLPMTRAPGNAVSSATPRASGFSHGSSRTTARSPVTGFSQTSPGSIAARSAGAEGSGCDTRRSYRGAACRFPTRRESGDHPLLCSEPPYPAAALRALQHSLPGRFECSWQAEAAVQAPWRTSIGQRVW